MSDESPTQPTRSTDSIPPERAVPLRTNHTINNISDYFRPRNQPQRRLNATPTPIIIPQPHITATNTNPVLIPIQVIMESPSLMPTVNYAETIQDIPHSRTAEQEHDTPMTPQEQLRTAQTLWAAMFQTSEDNVTIADGHRPIILSRENQKDNAAWGDSLTEKQATITRVYGMNVNGLILDKRGGQLDVLCKVIKEVQADVFCGQEHNLASETTPVRQITYNTVRQHWKRSRITFGTTPIPFPKQYKPGGTL